MVADARPAPQSQQTRHKHAANETSTYDWWNFLGFQSPLASIAHASAKTSTEAHVGSGSHLDSNYSYDEEAALGTAHSDKHTAVDYTAYYIAAGVLTVAVIAVLAYYGYNQGWFDGLFDIPSDAPGLSKDDAITLNGPTPHYGDSSSAIRAFTPGSDTLTSVQTPSGYVFTDSTGGTFTSVAMADVNVDGTLDIIALSDQGHTIVIDGTDLSTPAFSVIDTTSATTVNVVHDITGDGVPEIAFGLPASREVRFLPGNSDFFTQTQRDLATDPTVITWQGEAGTNFGHSLTSTNHSGTTYIATTAPTTGPQGYAYLIDCDTANCSSNFTISSTNTTGVQRFHQPVAEDFMDFGDGKPALLQKNGTLATVFPQKQFSPPIRTGRGLVFYPGDSASWNSTSIPTTSADLSYTGSVANTEFSRNMIGDTTFSGTTNDPHLCLQSSVHDGGRGAIACVSLEQPSGEVLSQASSTITGTNPGDQLGKDILVIADNHFPQPGACLVAGVSTGAVHFYCNASDTSTPYESIPGTFRSAASTDGNILLGGENGEIAFRTQQAVTLQVNPAQSLSYLEDAGLENNPAASLNPGIDISSAGPAEVCLDANEGTLSIAPSAVTGDAAVSTSNGLCITGTDNDIDVTVNTGLRYTAGAPNVSPNDALDITVTNPNGPDLTDQLAITGIPVADTPKLSPGIAEAIEESDCTEGEACTVSLPEILWEDPDDNGDNSFSLTGFPAGLRYAADLNQITGTPEASGTTDLTASVSRIDTVNGTETTLEDSALIPLTIAAPGFSAAVAAITGGAVFMTISAIATVAWYFTRCACTAKARMELAEKRRNEKAEKIHYYTENPDTDQNHTIFPSDPDGKPEAIIYLWRGDSDYQIKLKDLFNAIIQKIELKTKTSNLHKQRLYRELETILCLSALKEEYHDKDISTLLAKASTKADVIGLLRFDVYQVLDTKIEDRTNNLNGEPKEKFDKLVTQMSGALINLINSRAGETTCCCIGTGEGDKLVLSTLKGNRYTLADTFRTFLTSTALEAGDTMIVGGVIPGSFIDHGLDNVAGDGTMGTLLPTMSVTTGTENPVYEKDADTEADIISVEGTYYAAA